MKRFQLAADNKLRESMVGLFLMQNARAVEIQNACHPLYHTVSATRRFFFQVEVFWVVKEKI